jgi:DNA/RNA endonuclease G (NUC1)
MTGPGFMTRVLEFGARHRITRATAFGLLIGTSVLSVGGCGGSKTSTRITIGQKVTVQGVPIKEIVAKYRWHGTTEEQILYAAAKMKAGGADPGSKITAADIDAYLKNPADGRFLTSIAIAELRRDAERGPFEKDWEKKIAARAGRSLDAFLDGVKKHPTESGPEWIASQQAAVLKSAVAEMTGEPDLLRADDPSAKSRHQIVKHFMRIDFDPAKRIPNGVSYALYSEDIREGEQVDRTTVHFSRDEDEPRSANPRQYAGKHLDLGHQKPVSHSPNRAAMAEGMKTTNIVPQLPHLNRGRWEALEKEILAEVAGRGGRAVIFIGDLFVDDQGRKLSDGRLEWIGGGQEDGVAEPPYQFRVVLEQDKDLNIKAYAYILPNKPEVTDKSMLASIVTQGRIPVDRVEKLLGGEVDLLPALPDDVKKKLKADPNAVETRFAKEKIEVISLLELPGLGPSTTASA